MARKQQEMLDLQFEFLHFCLEIDTFSIFLLFSLEK